MTESGAHPKTQLKSYEVRGVRMIEMSGPLCMEDHSLHNTISQFLSDGDLQFVLRMTDVSHIDSAGLGQVIDAFSLIRSRQGTLKILAPSKRVRERLRTTRLDAVLEIYEDDAAA